MKFNKTLSTLILALVGFVLCAAAQTQRTATAIPTVVNGFIVAVTVTDGGAGYFITPSVTIIGGGGSGATAVATITNGAVDKVTIKTTGGDYSGIPDVVIAPPSNPYFDVSRGLIGYYPFNGDVKDESGNHNDGTVQGTVSFQTQDRFGQTNAILFENGSGWISLPPSAQHFMSEGSVSFWMKRKDIPNPNIMWTVFSLGASLGISGDGLAIGCPASNTKEFAFGKFDPPSNTWTWLSLSQASANNLKNNWTFIAATWGTNGMNFYQNGELVGNTPKNPTKGAGEQIRIGQNSWRQHYDGALDDLRIYSRSLSDDEVAGLYLLDSRQISTLSISVATVRVKMMVKPGNKYQLQTSSDFYNWITNGTPFVPTSPVLSQDFDVTTGTRYFRLFEVP